MFEGIIEYFKENKKLVTLITVVLVGFLVYSFLYIDFGAKKSDISVNTRSESFRVGDVQPIAFDELYLYVEGDNKLRESIEDEIRSRVVSGEVMSYANLKENFDGNVLAVKLLKKDISYTPLRSRGVYRVLYYYSSSGDTSYFDSFVRSQFGGNEDPVVFNSTEGHQLIEKGITITKGEINGVHSYRAAHSSFIDRVSGEIVTKLQDLKQ